MFVVCQNFNRLLIIDFLLFCVLISCALLVVGFRRHWHPSTSLAPHSHSLDSAVANSGLGVYGLVKIFYDCVEQ